MTNNKDTIITGGKIYKRCIYCNKLVRINKPIVGAMHICVDKETREFKRKIHQKQPLPNKDQLQIINNYYDQQQ